MWGGGIAKTPAQNLGVIGGFGMAAVGLCGVCILTRLVN